MAAPGDIAASAVDASPASSTGLQWLVCLPRCLLAFLHQMLLSVLSAAVAFVLHPSPFSSFHFYLIRGASRYCLYVHCVFPVNRSVSVACPVPLLNIHIGI